MESNNDLERKLKTLAEELNQEPNLTATFNYTKSEIPRVTVKIGEKYFNIVFRKKSNKYRIFMDNGKHKDLPGKISEVVKLIAVLSQLEEE